MSLFINLKTISPPHRPHQALPSQPFSTSHSPKPGFGAWTSDPWSLSWGSEGWARRMPSQSSRTWAADTGAFPDSRSRLSSRRHGFGTWIGNAFTDWCSGLTGWYVRKGRGTPPSSQTMGTPSQQMGPILVNDGIVYGRKPGRSDLWPFLPLSTEEGHLNY